MSAAWLSQTKAGIRIAVQVSPNARKSEIVSGDGDALRIKLQAPPVDGKANDALVQFLAKKLQIPRKQVTITHGQTNRRKLLEITADMAPEDIEKRLFQA